MGCQSGCNRLKPRKGNDATKETWPCEVCGTRISEASTEVLYYRPDPKIFLEIREKALGPNHPDVANTLENLAALYRATDRNTEAEAMANRAAKIRAIRRWRKQRQTFLWELCNDHQGQSFILTSRLLSQQVTVWTASTILRVAFIFVYDFLLIATGNNLINETRVFYAKGRVIVMKWQQHENRGITK